MDVANPPAVYFEAMRRLSPEPPDEETVNRIVEVLRDWCRKQEKLELKGVGPGGPHQPNSFTRFLDICSAQE